MVVRNHGNPHHDFLFHWKWCLFITMLSCHRVPATDFKQQTARISSPIRTIQIWPNGSIAISYQIVCVYPMAYSIPYGSLWLRLTASKYPKVLGLWCSADGRWPWRLGSGAWLVIHIRYSPDRWHGRWKLRRCTCKVRMSMNIHIQHTYTINYNHI